MSYSSNIGPQIVRKLSPVFVTHKTQKDQKEKKQNKQETMNTGIN